MSPVDESTSQIGEAAGGLSTNFKETDSLMNTFNPAMYGKQKTFSFLLVIQFCWAIGPFWIFVIENGWITFV